MRRDSNIVARFHLPQNLYAAMVGHAQASPMIETCGLFGGSAEMAASIYPVDNIAETPADSFFMAPRAQLAALRGMRERGEALCGIYHSHPHTSAWPSDRDLGYAAYPGVAYLIVSLADTRATVRAFRIYSRHYEQITLALQP